MWIFICRSQLGLYKSCLQVSVISYFFLSNDNFHKKNKSAVIFTEKVVDVIRENF